MFGLGPTELIIIAVIILFIFGAKRLPGIGKAWVKLSGNLITLKKKLTLKKRLKKLRIIIKRLKKMLKSRLWKQR